MLVVGVDVGTKNCAFAIVQVRSGAAAVIETTTIELSSFMRFNPVQSGRRIQRHLTQIIEQYSVECVVVERQPFVALRDKGSAKATIINCAIEAQILALTIAKSISILRVAPTTWRRKWNLGSTTKSFSWYRKEWENTDRFQNIYDLSLTNDVHQVDAVLIAINDFF